MAKKSEIAWEEKLRSLYESNAANQFIIYGNVSDSFFETKKNTPAKVEGNLLNFTDYLTSALLQPFEVIVSYEPGTGMRIEKGNDHFDEWRNFSKDQNSKLPKNPEETFDLVNHFLLYQINLTNLNRTKNLQIAVIIKSAELIFPESQGNHDFELNAMALAIRNWGANPSFARLNFASFLITEKLNDLRSILVSNPKSAKVYVPLPEESELGNFIKTFAKNYPTALEKLNKKIPQAVKQLRGSTLSSVEKLLKTHEYSKDPIIFEDLSSIKKSLVERDCQGLIEFIESHRNLNDIYGHEQVKKWLRQDVALWQSGEDNAIKALPMGYLLCGPVGTGKTFIVNCLAGEAGIPVVKMKNFRDKWVGSTEGNLEKIFALLQALGRCIVFIDEADQALGKRNSQDSSGVSGRVYSMMAKEMSNPDNRGKILWILASSRPDLIEVDLKRPGRIDVKIPLLPTTNAKDGFDLIHALCKKNGLKVAKNFFAKIKDNVPNLLTAGAAENIAVKTLRNSITKKISAEDALENILQNYQMPIAESILNAQIQLAISEASDLDFIPDYFKKHFGKES